NGVVLIGGPAACRCSGESRKRHPCGEQSESADPHQTQRPLCHLASPKNMVSKNRLSSRERQSPRKTTQTGKLSQPLHLKKRLRYPILRSNPLQQESQRPIPDAWFIFVVCCLVVLVRFWFSLSVMRTTWRSGFRKDLVEATWRKLCHADDGGTTPTQGSN